MVGAAAAAGVLLSLSLLGGSLDTRGDVTGQPEFKRAEALLRERLRAPVAATEVVVVRSPELTVDDLPSGEQSSRTTTTMTGHSHAGHWHPHPHPHELVARSIVRDAFKDAGCERIYIDRASGVVRDRPELTNALRDLHDGEDVLAVWRLDRIGRSLRHLVDLVGDLRGRKIGFRSLNDPIDTTSASGRLVFHVFAALAECERDLTRERTVAGLAAARVRGRVGGRPRVMTPEKIQLARRLYDEGGVTVQQIAETLGVSRMGVRGRSPFGYGATSRTGPEPSEDSPGRPRGFPLASRETTSRRASRSSRHVGLLCRGRMAARGQV